MRFHVVRRGVLWVTHRGNPDVFIRTFPPILDLHTSRTGSPLPRLGNKSETGKLVRKVEVKPQTSTKSRPKDLRSINDNYCVSNVVGLKDSVIVSDKMEGLNPSPVTLNVDSHVANAHIVTGLPQRKGVNPNACQLYTKIKYVKDVFCVGHLPSVNLVTNAQHAVLDPPVGARLNQCWEKWETLGSSPKVVNILREGYTLPFRFRPHLTRSPTVISNYHNPTNPFRGTVSADKQKCSRTGGQSKLTGVLQPAIFGTQTQQPVETGPRPEHLEHLFKHRVVQDGDPRDNKNLPTDRGVGHIHRFQRCNLPHTNSQSVQEVHAFSPPGSVLPVQSPPLWPVHSPHGVHSGGQRGQTHGTSKGYKDPPVPRRLAGESLYPRHLSPAYSNPSHTVPGTSLAGEQGKVRTGPTAGLQLRRLLVRPEGGQGQTNRGTLADLDRQDQINTVGSGMPGPKIHVPHRSTHSNRKTSPLRATTHETHTVAFEKQLEGPRVTGKGDPGPQVPPPPSKVVAGGKQCATRSTITPSKTCSANLYRCIKRRVGRSLRRAHCKGKVVPTRKQVTHNPLGAESSISSSKRVSNPSLQQDSVGSYRQHNSGCLYQQRRGDEIGLSVCPTVENTVLVHQAASNPQGTSHPRPAERDRRQAIQAWPDHSNRVVTSSRSVPSCMFRWHQPQVDLFATRFNNKLPQFVSPVPDPQAWAVDALSLSWEGLDPYAFPPGLILGKVVEKLQDYPCNRIILIAPGWPDMPWFWDLVAMSSQIPLCLPSIPNLVSQPFNQVLHRNLSNLNLHAWLLEPQQSRSKVSLRQWQHELRLLKEDQPDLSMRQSGPFLQSGASVIRWTSGHHLRRPLLTSSCTCFRRRSYNQALLMATDPPLLTNWAILPLMSARMRISLVSWIVSIETDLRAGGASPPGTFHWFYISSQRLPLNPLKRPP